MSISNSYPTQRPSLNLVFNGGSDQLDSRISSSRSDTPPTYAAPSAVHYWSNEKHLSSENLLPYSNDLSQSVWTKRNLTVPATNIAAPDGTSSASSLLETAATGTHDFYEEFTAVSGKSYTFTLYAKANGRDTLHVSPQATSTIASVVFDLTAVTSTVISGSAASHSITAIGSTGWYRLQVTVTATGSGTGFLQTYLKVGGSTSYAGDATKGAYIWGCQVNSTGQTVLNETSGQIHREFAPTLKSVSNAGDPRFEYDPTDGQSVGLLIEAQKSNLALNSNDYTAASWNKQRVTVTPSAAIGPDGQLSASLIAETTDTTTLHFMLPTAAITSGYSVGADKCTHSVFAKYAGKNLRMADGYNSPDGGSTIFDLQNGTVVSGGGSIQSCGNGWYRCSVTVTMSASTLLLPYIQLVDGTTWPNASDAGDGYSGILIFGLQTEQQSMSSYITTGSASVSRASDSCSVAIADIGYTGGPVTLFGEGTSADQSDYRALLSLHLDNDNFISLYAHSAYNRRALFEADGLGGVMSGGAGAKAALSFDTNDVSLCVAGGAVTSDTSQTLPDLTGANAYIGNWNGTSTQINVNGHVKRVALYNVALSDTELQAITS